MKVLKFGVSTVSTPENLRNVSNIIAASKKPTLAIARSANAEGVSELKHGNPDCAHLCLDEFNGIDESSVVEKIKSSIQNNKVLLVTGVAKELENKGGANYLAGLMSAELKAKELEIWTDVSGIMTANPRLVGKAFTIPHLSYDEALELAHFGASDIFPPGIQPAVEAGVPIRIKNVAKPKDDGSLITKQRSSSEGLITGISSISNISLLRVEGAGLIGVAGTAKRVFKALSESSINVILISQASSEHSICLGVSEDVGEIAKTVLVEEFEKELKSKAVSGIEIDNDNSIVAIVGENMRHSPGLAAKFFEALGRNGINVGAIAQGSSELNVSAVISNKDELKALNALHDSFFLSEIKTLNLFCVGVGQVGATFLRQLSEHRENLIEEHNLDLRVVGLANTKNMAFDKNGLDLSCWEEILEKSKQPSSLDNFVSEMKQLNLSNSVFVDSTASESVAQHYKEILSSSISVVTPNKRANSGAYERFLDLRDTADKANVKFFYETNVGAGLPIIETLKDLIRSGDEVISIEAVLSGTLSYIFNSFTEGTTFSDIVIGAKENGFTEPDPRDDLSGMDVARKLLILGREIGLGLEESDINIESLIPACTEGAKSVEDFLKLLPEADTEFTAKRDEALKQGKKLVYIASLKDGKAKVCLEAVDSTHPFYTLSGTDNIIAFRTKRYDAHPLVVKGPGAGTDVTAAGVFADIIRVASYL